MPVVFLSHSSRDKAFVRQLDRLLRAHGAQTFLDERDIEIGEDIPRAIYGALEHASHFCYIISRSSLESRWVAEELSIAKMAQMEARGVVVIPVLIDDVEPPTAVRHLRYADLRSRVLEERSREVAALLRAIGCPSPPNPEDLPLREVVGICLDAATIQSALADLLFLLRLVQEADQDVLFQRCLGNAEDEMRYRQLERRLDDLVDVGHGIGVAGMASVLMNDIEKRSRTLVQGLRDSWSISPGCSTAKESLGEVEESARYLIRRLAQLQQNLLVAHGSETATAV